MVRHPRYLIASALPWAGREIDRHPIIDLRAVRHNDVHTRVLPRRLIDAKPWPGIPKYHRHDGAIPIDHQLTMRIRGIAHRIVVRLANGINQGNSCFQRQWRGCVGGSIDDDPGGLVDGILQ